MRNKADEDKIKILIHQIGLKYNLQDRIINKIITSPYQFTRETIKGLKNGINEPNPKGGFFFNSFDFVRSVPLKIDRDGNKTEWYDSNFEQLENDAVALEYYEYVQAKIKELLKFYPQSYLEEKGIHKGFIPQIKESLFREMMQQNMKTSLKGLNELRKDWYTIKTFSKTYDHIDPGSGTTINTQNIAMLSPNFKTVENGQIVDTNHIITDIDDILSAFIPVTNMYKHKARIESTYNLVAESTKLLKGVEVSPNGTLIRNTKNESASDKSNLKHLREFVQFETDTFYGVQASKNEKASQTKLTTKEEKAEIEEIEDGIKEIDTKLANPLDLTEEKEEKLKREKASLENKKNDIGRSYSSTKSVKSVLKWYQLLAQGWNVHSPVIELVYGMMSNFTHASGMIDFNSKQLGRAYRIAFSNSNKLKNIVQKFNIVGEVVENDKNGYANSVNNKFKVGELIKPYHLQKLSDRVSKGSAGIAVLLNTSITDENDKVSNLYDALDDNGNLKLEFQTEENNSKWSTNLETTEISDFDRLRAKINEINIRNMGNYDPNQPIPWNSKAAGAAVLQFRRWLIEGVAQRFEGERESPNLKRTIKGRYITYKDVYNHARSNGKSGTKLIASSMFYLLAGKFVGGISDEKLNELGIENEVDIENMRKNATGVMFTIVMALALLLLQQITGDDEDKDFSYLKFLTNMGGRLQNDLWFYANPGEANNFLGNIVPASRLYDKASLFLEASFKQLVPDYDPQWSVEFEKGELKGSNKLFIRTGELIPGSSSLIKAYRLGTKVM